MRLINEILDREFPIRFYEGIDFDELINHPNDGSDGFVYCFIESWVKCVKSYNRENKLKSIIDNKEYSEFDWDSINNNYVAVYQTDGIEIEILYKSILDKVLNKYLPKSPYLSIVECDDLGVVNSGGAWKIESAKSSDC
jgi:hypothetical protein